MLQKRDNQKRGQKREGLTISLHLVRTVKCKNTGEEHLPHHAYYHDGILYYKGKPVDQK